MVELVGDLPDAPSAVRDLDGVLAIEEDGSVLRVRVAASASDALLLHALDLGLSVRRVEPLAAHHAEPLDAHREPTVDGAPTAPAASPGGEGH